MPIPNDSSPDVERLQFELLRKQSPAQRLQSALRLSDDLRWLSRRALLRARPGLSALETRRYWLESLYGRAFAAAVGGTLETSFMSDSNDLLAALAPVIRAFEQSGVRYYVGGSLASAFHGRPRSTQDVDVAAELDEATALAVVAKLQDQYYVSEAAVRQAVRRQACFNFLHLETSSKIDVFVVGRREFDRQALDRAVTDKLGPNELPVRIASAEDIILCKLEWFRLGNESSERQWNDVAEVVRLNEPQLDVAYLQKWAIELKVSDLLARVLADQSPFRSA